MFGNSKKVKSNQLFTHEKLKATLMRRFSKKFQKPISKNSIYSFNKFVEKWIEHNKKPIIMDSGCGNGISTIKLAKKYPLDFIVGIEHSKVKIEKNILKNADRYDNFFLLRADLVDFWRLLRISKISLKKNYILYPNPWPKKKHLLKRWHGHPIFPTLLDLGELLECRSNWKIYIEEFAIACRKFANVKVLIEKWNPYCGSKNDFIFLSNFEKKYCLSNHDLWRCIVSIKN
tara:strand:+ start:805 stop:1497 length:693 start_codon:yes stop_codon:yes gene_type:complete